MAKISINVFVFYKIPIHSFEVREPNCNKFWFFSLHLLTMDYVLQSKYNKLGPYYWRRTRLNIYILTFCYFSLSRIESVEKQIIWWIDFCVLACPFYCFAKLNSFTGCLQKYIFCRWSWVNFLVLLCRLLLLFTMYPLYNWIWVFLRNFGLLLIGCVLRTAGSLLI